MKKVLFTLAAVALMAAPALAADPYKLTAGGGVNTKQYHSYDGLICTDCHTLHGNEDGQFVDAGTGAGQWAGTGGFTALLKKGDWTDMCLSCHKAGFNTSATADLPGVTDGGWIAPIVMTLDGNVPANVSMPGGDFYWSNIDPSKGHNPAYTAGAVGGSATSKLMAADPTLGDDPPGQSGGGSLSGDDEWSCHSCHGMHSRFSSSYTAWRQVQRKVNSVVVTGDVSGLGVETAAGNKTQNTAYEPILSNSRGDVRGTGLQYFADRKDGDSLEGADLFAAYSDTNKNVYRGGFSSFCAACHGDFHSGGTAALNGQTKGADSGNTHDGTHWIKHPTNLKLSQSSKYGVSGYTAVITNTTGNNPNPVGYDYRYPLIKGEDTFVANGGDATTMVQADAASLTTGTMVNGDDRIMCLTCHVAHASKFDNMTRWDTNDHAFIADGSTDDAIKVLQNAAVTQSGDNPAYGCGKCHQKGGTAAFKIQF